MFNQLSGRYRKKNRHFLTEIPFYLFLFHKTSSDPRLKKNKKAVKRIRIFSSKISLISRRWMSHFSHHRRREVALFMDASKMARYFLLFDKFLVLWVNRREKSRWNLLSCGKEQFFGVGIFLWLRCRSICRGLEFSEFSSVSKELIREEWREKFIWNPLFLHRQVF